jgi:mannonate dehydratase
MAFEQTWRWFGPKDPISLHEVKQTGATGIVTALHHIPVGAVWTIDEILRRKRAIEAEALTWSVAESLPVHEDIKRRTGHYREYIENYARSLRNLGACGIDTVCYNFMPVLDWSRTELDVEFADGSITTRFDRNAFAAFDLFLLQRQGAEAAYSESERREARQYFDSLDDGRKQRLVETVLLGFPGSGEAYTLDSLREALRTYEHIDDDQLRQNLHSFLKEIIPVAGESGIWMAIHPDDPPWPLLGLPRVVSDATDVESILAVVDVPANGITLCTGSFGASARNDLVAMAGRFASRINFVHLRNVSRDLGGNFIEANHLDGDIDMYGVIKALLVEQKRRVVEENRSRRMPMRPDHGHLMSPDRDRKNIYPGYSLFGRMRGLAELRGLELGIRHALGL